MRIVLALPDGWHQEVKDERLVVTVPDRPIKIVVHPLIGTPNLDDVTRAALAWEASEKDVVINKDEESQSALMWPVRIYDAVVNGDHRLCVTYRCLEYVAAATASFGASAPAEAARSELLQLLLSGRPDFLTREIVALSQLFREPGN